MESSVSNSNNNTSNQFKLKGGEIKLNCDKCGKSICWVERDDNDGLCDECVEEKEQISKENK